jgi:hypothetical protein
MDCEDGMTDEFDAFTFSEKVLIVTAAILSLAMVLTAYSTI